MADQSSKSESSPAQRPTYKAFKVRPIVRRTPAPAKAVGSFVPRLTRKAMEKYGFSTAALLTDWAAIVGADLARHTKPGKLRWPRNVETYAETAAEASGRPGATLHLQVDAARALDIQYKGRQIIERINAYFGYRAIADLRIEQMPVAPPQPAPRPRDVVAVKTAAGRPGADLTLVTDERLRAALARVQKGMASR